MKDKKNLIIEGTINLVAENGMEGFSTRDLSKLLGISHTNIYPYFGSKEDLLMECYLTINKEIANIFADLVIPEQISKEEIYECVHEYWKKYFNFMIKNGNHSLYYYTYRESNSLKNILMRNNDRAAKDMESFMEKFALVAGSVGVLDKIKPDYFWAYILDGTGVFVKHILRGNTEFKEEDIEIIWKLLMGGVMGALKG